MQQYSFQIDINVEHSPDKVLDYIDSAYANGCSDCVIGLGKNDLLSFYFSRNSTSIDRAIEVATTQLEKAIPNHPLNIIYSD